MKQDPRQVPRKGPPAQSVLQGSSEQAPRQVPQTGPPADQYYQLINQSHKIPMMESRVSLKSGFTGFT